MKVFLLVVLFISSCYSPVMAFPEKGKTKGEDRFDLQRRPKTIPPKIPLLKICIENVMYYVNLGGGMAPALTTEGKVIVCGRHKS